MGQRLLKEDEYMTELKASMNSHRASRTQQQYRENNREKIQEYKKEHYDTNKDYYKEYNETNKDRKQEYDKKYRKDNKEIITKKLKQNITCKCGCVVTKIHLKRHERTKKHTDLINLIQ